ncbi:MAG: MFS transporter, partial [Pseudomonadota bacterium]
LLGVGWNFSYLSASYLLVGSDNPAAKGIQGINDTVIALFATICSFASGALLAWAGWHSILFSVAIASLFVAFVCMLIIPPIGKSIAKKTL